ncbi:hypothetical protein [Haladaptatus sp. DJG-WS-42]|uniref:hypothetical protein n=1 Tax=Haladaptatus sp. DJG-WS-42 TaxID=3120516 RepID=UPI0030CBCC88
MNTEMGDGGLAERIASELNYAHDVRVEPLELVEFLRQRAGNSLSWVAAYDDGDETLYLHSTAETGETNVPDIVAQLRGDITRTTTLSSPYDALRATVQLFEDAVVLHLPQGNSCGVAAGFDTDAARILRGFIDDCELHL